MWVCRLFQNLPKKHCEINAPKYRVFSGPSFPELGLNSEIYFVNLYKNRIQISLWLADIQQFNWLQSNRKEVNFHFRR